jgi:PIN domain nuclease of toxin-antitoxin system
MKFLLDTHIWIWSHEAVERLGSKTKASLSDVGQQRFVSAISTFEIARLIARGLLRFRQPFPQWKEDSLRELHAVALNVTHEIAWEAYNLPGIFHNDPADRILVATARLHDLIVVTADDLILRYAHVKTAAARR